MVELGFEPTHPGSRVFAYIKEVWASKPKYEGGKYWMSIDLQMGQDADLWDSGQLLLFPCAKRRAEPLLQIIMMGDRSALGHLPLSYPCLQPLVEINPRYRETKGFFRRFAAMVSLGQGYERSFSVSAAFRGYILSESTASKWSLLVACHPRVAISCMCLVGCQLPGHQTSVGEPLFVMN